MTKEMGSSQDAAGKADGAALSDAPVVAAILSDAGDLPAPRLQFRWEHNPGADDALAFDNWLCFYELVLPLRELDIRREIYKDGERVGERAEQRLLIGTTRVGRFSTPCEQEPFEAPFRDGAHAQWDSEAFGGLPIFCIAPSGRAAPKPAS